MHALVPSYSMHILSRQTAWVIGLLLVFIGLIGFASPGFHGPSGALIGFIPDTLRNLFYLAIGSVGLFTLIENDNFTRIYLLMVGVLFAALSVDGFAWNGQLFNLFPMTDLDHSFHMLLSGVALVVGIWDLEPAPKKRGFRK